LADPRDHHRRQDRLLELLGLDLGVEVLVLLMQRDEAFVRLRTLDQLVEVLEPPMVVGSDPRPQRRADLDRNRPVLGRLLPGRPARDSPGRHQRPAERRQNHSLRHRLVSSTRQVLKPP